MGSILRRGPWSLRAGSTATTIARDDDAVWSFDLEGRPLSWWERGTVYKRTLGSEVHSRRTVAGERERRRLHDDEAASALRGILEGVGEFPGDRLGEPHRSRLRRILSWSSTSLLAERERFESAYRPIAILPPDQYLAVVLQATFGCSWNRCTFCDFYQGRPFVARPARDLAAHAGAVADLLGGAVALRRSIFLADGNALVMSNDRLREILRVAVSTFPGRPVVGFVDVTGGERKPVEDWMELGRLGLARVHVGLETGHEPLLRWMRKPGTNGDAIDLVTTLVRAGIDVAPIFMVGVGGDRHAEAHAAETIDLIARLPLTPRDLVYLSPFVEHGDSEYARIARAEGIAPLSPEATEAQLVRIRDAVRSLHPGVRVARYDLREFLY